jgi:hypothetical protein
MSKENRPQKHHRNLSVVDKFSYGFEFDLGFEGEAVEVTPEDEICVLMNSIQNHNFKRELSQQDQKVNIKKKLLSLYQQSKNIKPKVKSLNTSQCRNSQNKEKLFVPVLTSKRKKLSPAPPAQPFQSPKLFDLSKKSFKSHTNSLNISPSSNRRHSELSYLV